MSYTVTEVRQPDGWNEWLTSSPFADVLQSWEWGEVKKGELWQSLRVRVSEDQTVVAQAQVLIRKMPVGMSLFYIPRGPVLNYTDPSAGAILQAFLQWLKERAAAQRALMIKLGPAVDPKAVPHIADTLSSVGLRPSFRSVQAQHTYVVDLSQPEAAIFDSFDKDTRNLVRRSAREQVVVDRISEQNQHKELRLFHNLYMAASERGKFVARPWSQMSRLWDIMAPAGMVRIYVASFEEKPLAANLVLTLGNRSYQLYAGSRRDEPKKFATYALQWATMQDLKKDGFASYDMWGRAPSGAVNHSWAGVSLFKKGFGGAEVDFVGDYDLPLSPTYPLFTTANRLRSKLLGGS